MPSLTDCNEDFHQSQISHSQSDFCLVSRPGEAGKKNHKLTMARCTLGFDLWQMQLSEEVIELAKHTLLMTIKLTSKKSFKHRKSGFCLSQPLEVGRDKDVPKLPVLTKCGKRNSEQMWSLKAVEWLPKSNYDEF
uniref:Ricin B-type lectin domain-containing protein n=1 Tax=Heterorhabditis bacteriophora TaxID=37862 RepID=A0A1I7XAS2_HETBA